MKKTKIELIFLLPFILLILANCFLMGDKKIHIIFSIMLIFSTIIFLSFLTQHNLKFTLFEIVLTLIFLSYLFVKMNNDFNYNYILFGLLPLFVAMYKYYKK